MTISTRLRTTWLCLLCALLATLPFERIPSLGIGSGYHITIRISQVIGALLLVAAVPLTWHHRRDLLRPPWILLIGFVIICACTIPGALDHQRAALVTLYTSFVAALAWTIAHVVDNRHLASYQRWLFVGTAIAVGFGFYQFFGDLLGLPHWATGLRSQYGKIVFGFPRVQSTALEPLYFGDYLLIPTALLLARLGLRGLSWRQAGLLLASLTALWLTVSRGAIGALLVILFIAVVAAGLTRRWRAAVAAVGAVIGGLVLAIGCIVLGTLIGTHNVPAATAIHNFSHQSVNVSDGESSIDRGITRRLALNAIREHPWLGVGAGNFGAYAHTTHGDMFTTTSAIVNNESLEILAETGVLGALMLGAFVIALLVQWATRFSLQVRNDLTVWQLGLMAALIGIAVQYQTFSTLYITHVWVGIGMVVGLTAAATARRNAIVSA